MQSLILILTVRQSHHVCIPLQYYRRHLCKENWIYDPVGILSVTADGNIYVESDILVHNAEWDRIWCAIFIAHQFLRVEEIDTLVSAGIATEGNTAADF